MNKIVPLLVILLLVITIPIALPRDQKHDLGTVTIRVQPVFNGIPLKLEDQYYVNDHGDTINISIFKCYLTNICLYNENSTVLINKSFLYDAEEPEEAVAKVNPGKYNGVTFTVGVDSIDNTNGANTGDLDPIKGMYWAWNSGYIMAKLEGHSKACKTLHHEFQFHIGGYMPPYNTARKVKLSASYSIIIDDNKNTVITIIADVAKWFAGNLDLSQTNRVLTPGREAMEIADRYAKMFSLNPLKK